MKLKMLAIKTDKDLCEEKIKKQPLQTKNEKIGSNTIKKPN